MLQYVVWLWSSIFMFDPKKFNPRHNHYAWGKQLHEDVFFLFGKESPTVCEQVPHIYSD